MNPHQPLETPRSVTSIFVTGFATIITVAVMYMLLASNSHLAQGVGVGLLLVGFAALSIYALRHADD